MLSVFGISTHSFAALLVLLTVVGVTRAEAAGYVTVSSVEDLNCRPFAFELTGIDKDIILNQL